MVIVVRLCTDCTVCIETKNAGMRPNILVSRTGMISASKPPLYVLKLYGCNKIKQKWHMEMFLS